MAGKSLSAPGQDRNAKTTGHKMNQGSLFKVV